MTKFSVPLTEVRNYLIFKILLWIVILLLGTTFYAYVEGFPSRQNIFFATAIVAVFWIVLYNLLALREDHIINLGRFTLTGEEISIELTDHKFRFSFEEIESIVLEINETSQDVSFGRYNSKFKSEFKLNRKKSGHGNTVELRTKARGFHKYNIYIDSAAEIEQLDEILEAQKNLKIILKRRGGIIQSIKASHFRDYPIEHFNTFRRH